eukprot:Lithocolla_globosa_v1_NODE_6770_length_1037_cov_16.720978.p1 type:complete len:176 gc:universal NODE_6770_length_1037_cov_16.720978:92-619(+)
MPSDPRLPEYFQKADTDRSGRISAKELQACLCNGSWTPFNIVTVQMMVDIFDSGHGGTVDFQGFERLWESISAWQQTFNSFDRDRSNSIDTGELTTALTQFGYRFSPQFITMLMAKFDLENTTTIAFDDFVQICLLLQRSTQHFQMYDTNRTGVAQISYEQFLTSIFQVFVSKIQ